MVEFLKKLGFRTLAVLLGLVLPYLAAEGLYSVSSGADAGTSLAYALYSRWFVDHSAPEYDPGDPTTGVITRVSQLEAMFDAFKANGIAIGNSPFKELKREEVALNREEDGCWTQKPELRKTVAYLRSNLFNPFDQMTYFHDRDRALPPEVEDFFRRYGFRQVRHSTNEYGERLTLPRVESNEKVLVAGDSVALGVMLDDAETLASRLQESDARRQYVNLGISGAKSADILCALDRAAERYPGQIRALVYVFCENDFEKRKGYRSPEELIAWLVEFQRRETVDPVIFLYVPFIYNVLPEVTRVRGHSHWNFPYERQAKRRLLGLVREAGFDLIDFTDVANEEREAGGSLFAPFALYVDHSHFSTLGVERLLPRFAALR